MFCEIQKSEKIELLQSCIGVGLYGLLFFKQFQILAKSEIEKESIMNQRIYRPEEILQKLLRYDLGIQENFKQYEQGKLKGTNILIQGIAESDFFYNSTFQKNQNNPNMKFLLRKTIKVKKYSNLEFFKDSHIITHSKINVLKYMENHKSNVQEHLIRNINLVDPNDQNKICLISLKDQNIKNTLTNSKFSNIYQKFKGKFSKNQYKRDLCILDSSFDHLDCMKNDTKSGFFKEFMKGFLGFWQVLIWPINILLNKQPFIKGIEVGEEHYEVAITKGKILTVFGDLVFDFKNNQMSIENPLYIMKDRRGLLKYLQNKVNKNRKILLFYLISLMGFGFWCIKILLDCQKRKLKINRNDQYKKLKNIEDVVQDIDDDEMKCIICYEKVRSIVLKPCMHTLMCRECLKKVISDKNQCPVCKIKILEYIEILAENI